MEISAGAARTTIISTVPPILRSRAPGFRSMTLPPLSKGHLGRSGPDRLTLLHECPRSFLRVLALQDDPRRGLVELPAVFFWQIQTVQQKAARYGDCCWRSSCDSLPHRDSGIKCLPDGRNDVHQP